jgi:hypothetical protein
LHLHGNGQNYLRPGAIDRILSRTLVTLVWIGLIRGHFYVLEVRGRKSGKIIRLPVDRGHPHRRCRGLLAHYFLAFEGGQTAIARSARYSRLIGADEASTLQAFKTIKTELLDPTIEAHNGELLSQRATGCSSSSGV